MSGRSSQSKLPSPVRRVTRKAWHANTESTQVVGGGGGAGKVVPPYAVSEEDSERDRATPAG